MTDKAFGELVDETDADLLVYMSMAADDATVARSAWDVFYQRHMKYIWAVCHRAYADLMGGSEGVADLVAETFRRAYERADTFDSRGVDDASQQQKMVRAWLIRIAQRLAQEAMRNRSRLPTNELSVEHWQQIAQPDEAKPTTDNTQVTLVREALEMLTEKEQIVLRTTMQWYRPESPNQRLPNETCRELAMTLQTTPENLRQIRRRALKKIRDYVQTHLATDGRKEKPHG